jgi:hypothetical protein
MRSFHFCTRPLFAHAVCLLAAMSFLAIPTARATYTINMQQVGTDVVATGSGSINLGGLTQAFSLTTQGVMDPSAGGLILGSNLGFVCFAYEGAIVASPFGPGGPTPASSGSGAGFDLGNGEIGLPIGYVSGTPVGTYTDTWSNRSFSTLGVIPGTYTTTLPSDSIIVNILPEPASLSLLGLAGLALLRRR